MWAPTVVVPYTLAESDPHALYPHPQERSRIPRWASEGERLVSCIVVQVWALAPKFGKRSAVRPYATAWQEATVEFLHAPGAREWR